MPALEQVRQSVTFDDVIAASERIRGLVEQTPVLRSSDFDKAAGVRVFFKCENMQRGGAFKVRGAMNFMLQLNEEQRRRGVVAFSSGNHAQAVAIAAAHLGVSATIVMPTDAPKSKLGATQSYGPRIVLYERLREDREVIAARIASETGAITVPPYDHPWIVAGQGTAALEFLRQCPELDGIATPLGGGGLLAGTLVAVKGLRPATKVFGVEPEMGDDWHQSLRRGEPVRIEPPATIADGLRTLAPGKVPFPIVQTLGDGVLLVSEQQIKEGVRALLSRVKVLAEPSGAAAAAAVLHKMVPPELKSVGVILSGGNIDMDVLADICREIA